MGRCDKSFFLGGGRGWVLNYGNGNLSKWCKMSASGLKLAFGYFIVCLGSRGCYT